MAEQLHDHLTNHLREPVLLQHMISDWPAANWDMVQLEGLLKDVSIPFRIGKHNTNVLQWEGDCQYADATIAEFLIWLEGRADETNPLAKYDKQSYWCYADYKYMVHWFDEIVLKAVNWSRFGFPGRDGNDSTFWLGTKGACTVCHYDTYGWNLVAQLHGRKRWVLFPPEDTPYMYPTRVPYEESSVFSRVNVTRPNLEEHPLFRKTTPYVVTLNPGDVLYVPRHWWHLVESIDTSISINTWIEMETDMDERLSEAVVKTLVCALMSQTPNVSLASWLNPTESLTDHAENMHLLNESVRVLNKKKLSPRRTENSNVQYTKASSKDDTIMDTEQHGHMSDGKKRKYHDCCGDDNIYDVDAQRTCNCGEDVTRNIVCVERMSFSEFLSKCCIPREDCQVMESVASSNCDTKERTERDGIVHGDIVTTDFLQCLLQPQTIRAVCETIKSNYCRR